MKQLQIVFKAINNIAWSLLLEGALFVLLGVLVIVYPALLVILASLFFLVVGITIIVIGFKVKRYSKIKIKL